ncbi:YfcE family phosphodiesterase [Halobacteriales archaeon SW_7_68_16]|nr:MAG: YfcE family phosphodiesterase [Halobacteriales archaeon SW_7_68_16]
MLAVFADTHRSAGHGLTDAERDAALRADRIVHAGDFTTPAVYDAFADLGDLHAVHGNADAAAVRKRLPTVRALAVGSVRVLVVHRQRGGGTGLSMLGRERDADLVVSGHTHVPTLVDGDPVLCNPGSHADPRGASPGFATVVPTADGATVSLRAPDGDVVDSRSVDG